MLTEKKRKIVIRTIGVVEILIGATIFLSFIVASLITPPGRPKSVYAFVAITSLISVVIGVGLFKYKSWARRIIIFFAGYVIITKFLLLSNLVNFTGNTINFMPTILKDILSFIYHISILFIFNLKVIKKSLN